MWFHRFAWKLWQRTNSESWDPSELPHVEIRLPGNNKCPSSSPLSIQNPVHMGHEMLHCLLSYVQRIQTSNSKIPTTHFFTCNSGIVRIIQIQHFPRLVLSLKSQNPKWGISIFQTNEPQLLISKQLNTSLGS